MVKNKLFKSLRNHRSKYLPGVIGLIVILLPIVYFAAKNPRDAKADWFNDNWRYRKKVTFNNSSTEVTSPRRFNVEVNTSTLISAGTMNSNCSDIRFTTQSGDILPYYLNTGTAGCNNASSDYFVLLDSVDVDDNVIYVYYGNSSATSEDVGSQFSATEFSASESTGSEETGPGPIAHWKFDEGREDSCDNGADYCDSTDSKVHIYDNLSVGNTLTTTTDVAVTSTDEGLGEQTSWSHRVFYDPNNLRWHLIYVDGSGLLHTISTSDGSNWDDGTTLDSQTRNYDDFSCAIDVIGSSTYMHCAYAPGGSEVLYYKRCELTGSGSYISCGSEIDVYDSGVDGGGSNGNGDADSLDDIASPKIVLDSNRCVLIAVDFEDDSESNGDEHEIWLFKEASTCGDGSWSHETGFPKISVQSAAGYTRDVPIGLESFGDLDAQIYYIDTDSSTSAQLLTIHFDGDTNSMGTERTLSSDIEYDLGRTKYWSVIINPRNITFALDDATNDIDAFVISTKNGLLGSQVDTNLDTTGTTSDLSQTITAVVDTNAAGSDDIWLFAADDDDPDDLYYNISTDGGYTWAGSGTLWENDIDNGEIKFLSAYYNDENCDIMVSWVGDSASPWDVRSKVINTGSCAGDTGTVIASWQEEDQCVNDKCIAFNGSDSALVAPNESAIDFNEGFSDNLTIQTWVKVLSDGEGNVGQIFQKGTYNYLSVSNESGGFVDLNASIDLGLPGVTSNATLTIADALTVNKWHHISLVYEDDADDEITIYIDGVNRGSSTNGSGSLAAETYDLYIGGITSSNFHGLMDDFKMYPYARTEENIKTDYLLSSSVHGVSARIGKTDEYLMSESLMGYWKFDESSGNASDSGPIGNNLTDTNTVSFVQGTFGNAGDFESSNSEYQYISDNASLSITSDISISAWINPESVTASTAFNIAGKWDGTNESYLLQQYGDEIRFYVDSSSNYVTTNSVNLSTGNYYHILATYNATNQSVDIYVNGIRRETTVTGTIPSSIGDDGGRFHVGAEDSTTTAANFYDGIIDDVRLWAKSFSPLEAPYISRWVVPPVGWYKFDENTGTSLYDSSSNTNVGALDSDMTEDDWVPGKLGSALEFDGTNDSVLISSPDLPTGDFTYAMWFYPTATSDETIVESTNSSAGDEFRMEINTNNFDVFVDSTSISGSSTLSSNQWYHLAVTRSGSNITTYINGVAEQTGTDGDTLDFEGCELILGADNDSSCSSSLGNYANGKMDELLIYDFALTEGQLYEVMNSGFTSSNRNFQDSRIAHWKFDESDNDNAEDSSGNGLTGNLGSTLYSCPGGTGCPSRVDGLFGRALDFDGSNDHIGTSSGSEFGIFTDLSISAWINFDTVSDGEVLVDYSLGASELESSNALYSIAFDTTSGTDIEYVHEYSTGSDESIVFDTNLSSDTWYHLVLTRNSVSKTVSLYIDGKLISIGSYSNAPTGGGNSSFFVGSYGGGGGNFFDGTMDELSVYEYVLSSNEVSSLYNNGAISISVGEDESDDLLDGAPTGLVGYWNLDENGSTTVYDRSGNGYDGTWSTSNGDMVPGKYGSGFQMYNDDVGSDEVTVSDPASGDLDFSNTDDFTFSFWSKIDNVEGDSYLLSKGGYTTTDAGYSAYVLLANGNPICNYTDGNSSGQDNPTASINIIDSDWHHVTCVMDRDGSSGITGYSIYVDGVFYAVVTPSEDDGSNGSSLEIGEAFSSGAEVTGVIDEVKIYNNALTPAQVAYDYNRGKPLGWWKLDECQGDNAYDSSPWSNHGAITIGATGDNTSEGSCSGSSNEAWNAGTTGKINYSLDLDGTDDVVTISNADQIDFDIGLSNEFTIMTWINADSDGEANVGEIFDKGTNTYCRTDNQGTTDLDLQCNLDLSGTTSSLNIADALITNTWHHVALVWINDGDDEFTIYVDGKNVGTSTGNSGDFNSDANSLLIGGSSGANFDGQIDDFRVYGYALSEAQIRKVMNQGSVYFGPVTGSP